jgi:hypothetical protein
MELATRVPTHYLFHMCSELRVTQEESLSILRTIKENTSARPAPAAGSLLSGTPPSPFEAGVAER